MNITSRSQYALKVMIDLATSSTMRLVTKQELAQRQHIPQLFLEQILMSLRSGGLLTSVRGRAGGYRLALAADGISVWQIFECVESGLLPVKCLDAKHHCAFSDGCSTKNVWQTIVTEIKNPLVKLTLATLVKQKPAKISKVKNLDGIQLAKELRHGIHT